MRVVGLAAATSGSVSTRIIGRRETPSAGSRRSVRPDRWVHRSSQRTTAAAHRQSPLHCDPRRDVDSLAGLHAVRRNSATNSASSRGTTKSHSSTASLLLTCSKRSGLQPSPRRRARALPRRMRLVLMVSSIVSAWMMTLDVSANECHGPLAPSLPQRGPQITRRSVWSRVHSDHHRHGLISR